MELRRYQDVYAFNERAEPFLIENEAENNLLLGIIYDLIRSTLYDDIEPYLATVHDDSRVVAAALRTPPHNLVISRAPDEAVNLIADDLQSLYPNLRGVLGPKETSRAFSEAWRERTGCGFRPGTAQRIYALEQVTPPDDVPGELRPVTRDDAGLLMRWLSAFEREAYGEEPRPYSVERLLEAYLEGRVRGLHVWHDEQPVSMVGYSGPTPNGIRVGPVYTPSEFRQRGYGSAATATLSQLLLDQGRRFCFLFTDLSNPTSNSIYQKIGYRPVVDVDEYRFASD